MLVSITLFQAASGLGVCRPDAVLIHARAKLLEPVQIEQIAGHDLTETFDLRSIIRFQHHKPQVVVLVRMLREVGADVARRAG